MPYAPDDVIESQPPDATDSAAPPQQDYTDTDYFDADAPPISLSDPKTWKNAKPGELTQLEQARKIQDLKDIAKFAKEHPAATGATIGGTAASIAGGGIPAIGLIAAGGAGYGLAAHDVAEGRSQGAKANVSETTKQGLGAMAGEGVGRVIGYGMARGANWLMDRAFNPPDSLASEFPELSDTAIKNAIAISKGGLTKARLLLKRAKDVANGVIAKADQTGATVNITDATAGLQNTLMKIADSSDIVGDTQTLARIEREVMAGRQYVDPKAMTLTLKDADALKTTLQREARQAYQRWTANKSVSALAAESEAKKDMATTLNLAIDRAAEKAGFPGYGEANGKAQQLIGLNRAMRRATRAGPNVVQAMVRPTLGATLGAGLGYEGGHPGYGAAVGAYLTSPGGMSRLALLLGNPAVQAVFRQVPKPIAAALAEYYQRLTSEGSGTPPAPGQPK